VRFHRHHDWSVWFNLAWSDGFLLALTRYSSAQWAEERRFATGEQFEPATGTSSTPDSTS
jgi:hypothetical protein